MWFLVKLNFCLYKAHKNLSSLFFVFDVSVLFIPVLIHSSEVKFASEENMDGGGGGIGGAFSDSAMDLDFMDELLYEGCWLEATDALELIQSNENSTSPYAAAETDHLGGGINLNTNRPFYPDEAERDLQENSSQVYPKVEEINETLPGNHQGLMTAADGIESSRMVWIAPRANQGPYTPVKDRLMEAIHHMRNYIKDRNVLVQIWVPGVNREGRQVLTTRNQPYFHDPSSKSLLSYRSVSESYQFAADENSVEYAGLPGRVYLGKLPEWTPDVRFFKSDEYPRVDFAEQCDVHGSIALPVFGRGSRTCLGVVEIITTSQKSNYKPDLENVCKALEAVDLQSSENVKNLCTKASDERCNFAVNVIKEVLKSVCKTNNLPLALTWAPCGQEVANLSGKKSAHCFLTVEPACVVEDRSLSEFVDACSEHQLFQGQGLVGRAVTFEKPCFATDITAFTKSFYPLSHHARMFGLHAAVAIPMRAVNTGWTEFVLEFFLPKECQDYEKQKHFLNSLLTVIQQSCKCLPLVIDKELEEIILPVREGRTSNASSPSKETSPEPSSWIAQIVEAQQKGKGVSWDYQKEELEEEFKVTTHWDDTPVDPYQKPILSGFEQFQQHSSPQTGVELDGDSPLSGRRMVGNRKPGEKRRTKAEKTISLPVLRQYFAGSLKDAAKSIGVCPTTLKRICRQHGITRWPSRKIKKVGHSLRKLQLVIDSVQGAEGAIQIGSFYTSFPELSSPNVSGNDPFSPVKTGEGSKLNPQLENGHDMPSIRASASKSPSSSGSQSSGSSTCCSTGANLNSATINTSTTGDALMVETSKSMLKRARSDVELHALNLEEPKLLARSQSHKTLGVNGNLESLPPPLPKHNNQTGVYRVKATYGEEKIRFSLQPNWGFREVQQEIAKRFKVEDINKIDLKYLDDDHEWVLLTCDADLEECIDIYKSSQSHTIKVSLHVASKQKLGMPVPPVTAPS